MVTYAKLTKPGNREVNEDSIGVFQHDEDLCFVLCDGLGGHGRGEDASSLVVDSLSRSFENEAHDEDFLPNALDKAQTELMAKQHSEKAQSEMKTTAVALLLTGEKMQWIHVGDSRLYVFTEKSIETRTLDHSVPQMLVRAKQLREAKIRFHPDRNKLLRVMGVEWEKSAYDLSQQRDILPRCAFLLCSDGFWEIINEKKMCATLKKSSSAQQWLERMQKIVEKKGAKLDMDNYSAITVFAEKNLTVESDDESAADSSKTEE